MTICGKWKTLTRRYMKELNGGAPNIVGTMRAVLVRHVCSILLIAGVSASPLELENKICITFGEKITGIAASSLALRDAIGEGSVSSDLQIILPFFNDEFRGGGYGERQRRWSSWETEADDEGLAGAVHI
ncbi:hypothetical protein NM688_g1296 [Phlebia brevispora]|uniref:Uncharacterized protein n=1 Tax=Phlebia brevispora TaxID=194682 RepID=A0ACC1TC46_9APHY|nr:hypothetical protein NM688_g1296 [Phlebia brevispora]